MSRPWYETYPRKYWGAQDHRAARLAGVPEPYQPADLGDIKPLASSVQPVSFSGGLYTKGGETRAERQSRAIDERLRALGMPTPRRRVR